MNELLTTKQVQDYLKVDRTTIYRMLKDGRLNGVKVGKQWRFPRSEIEGLSSGPANYDSVTPSYDNALPLDCVQTIQDVTADMMEVGAVATDEGGFPLTAVSNASRFCRLILETESGRQACAASWRRLFRQGGDAAQLLTCHAGCQFARAPAVAGAVAIGLSGVYLTIKHHEEAMAELRDDDCTPPCARLCWPA